MNARTKAFVRHRAQNQCEYCQARQDEYDFSTFHVEHIIAQKHVTDDSPDNLCLACPECNLAKSSNLSGYHDGKIVPLFHPRRQVWTRHFRWDGPVLKARTKTGQVTIDVLNINDPRRVAVRESLMTERDAEEGIEE